MSAVCDTYDREKDFFEGGKRKERKSRQEGNRVRRNKRLRNLARGGNRRLLEKKKEEEKKRRRGRWQKENVCGRRVLLS